MSRRQDRVDGLRLDVHVGQVSMLLVDSLPTPCLGEDALAGRSKVSREQPLW